MLLDAVSGFCKWSGLAARWDFPVFYNASCVLCSDYFEADWFDSSLSVKLSVGYELQHKHVLLDTAVPKIFARSGTLKEAHHKWQVDRPRPRRIRLPSGYSCQLTVSPTLMVQRTLLVSIETTKVVAISSSTRGRTSSRSENANNEKMETLSLCISRVVNIGCSSCWSHPRAGRVRAGVLMFRLYPVGPLYIHR